MDSLSLRLTSSRSQAPTAWLPAPPLSQLHGERAISRVSSFQLTRSTRLTLTHPRRTDEDIVEALCFSPSTLTRVRKRFVTESLGAALDHRPQPPRPEKVKITDAVEKQLIQLACSDPPQGRCCWTLELLADRLVALGCVQDVSREAVRRALKKTTSSPGS